LLESLQGIAAHIDDVGDETDADHHDSADDEQLASTPSSSFSFSVGRVAVAGHSRSIASHWLLGLIS
jgi:hypothetical protein